MNYYYAIFKPSIFSDVKYCNVFKSKRLRDDFYNSSCVCPSFKKVTRKEALTEGVNVKAVERVMNNLKDNRWLVLKFPYGYYIERWYDQEEWEVKELK